MNFVIRK